jgi:hypothetical protein
MNKCILVGNSSSALNKELGSYIDSFENVIRFNRFKIKEYKKDLGVKCTHWVLNYPLVTDGRNYLVKNISEVNSNTIGLKQALVLTTSRDIRNINKVKEDIKHKGLKENFFIEVICKQYKSPFKYKPTTGYLTVNYFLNHFPKLTLIGFDFGKSNHYWGNNGIADVPQRKHEWDKEKKYIDSLVKQNKIEII